jgi:2-oxoglutarate dehydrogenase E2 component (dihydrolipoamide succinyltransferase)
MAVEIKVPRLAESISEAVLVQWLKEDGALVRADEPIATLETDKAAVEIPADQAGVLHHARQVGDKVEVGDVIARLDDAPAGAAAPPKTPPPAATPRTPPPVPEREQPGPDRERSAAESLSPAVRRMVEEFGLDPARITGTGPGGRVLKEDVQRHLEARASKPAAPVTRATPPAPIPAVTPAPRPTAPAPTPARAAPAPASAAPASMPREIEWGDGETERAVPMTRLRQRIAERLVQAQHTAAILTTFNEVDMSAVIALRERLKESFEQRHGVKLSYMSFFTRACVLALQQMPAINAEIRGTEVVYHRHVHMGIAVQTERGLVVPIVHFADQRSFGDLEKEIARLARAARDNKLSLDELSGGTFTISNGGVFGSLFSTPILNPPQSGILGMHKIEKRPIVLDDQVAIRPMMYLALSYDHRIVDGEQAVTFLVSVKQRIEDPERMLLDV